MVERTTLIAAVMTAGVNLAAVNFVAGVEAEPRAETASVQKAAAPESSEPAQSGSEPAALPSGPSPIVRSLGKNTKTFTAQGEPQTLEVAGANFSPGSTATLIAPLGVIMTFTPASLSELTPASFKLTVTLDEPGTYELSIRSATGLRSNTLPVVVIR